VQVGVLDVRTMMVERQADRCASTQGARHVDADRVTLSTD
jgi:hypothetical protein